MSTIVKMPIDDEMLAAYLDGRLDEEKTEYVENAIENSPELQWTIDRWIEAQMGGFASSKVDSLPTFEKKKKPHFNRRVWSIAASIVALLAVSLPLLINLTQINPYTGMSEGFPVSERYESEYPSNQTTPINPTDEISDDSQPVFSYDHEYYKTATTTVEIITWDPPMDSFCCTVYSGNNRLYNINSINRTTNNRRIAVVPLRQFESRYYPLTIKVEFFGSDFVYSDSFIVNYQ